MLTAKPTEFQISAVSEPMKPVAKSGKKVGMRYIGKLDNGKVFDSNTKGAPLVFNLGRGEVIKGWDQGKQQANKVPHKPCANPLISQVLSVWPSVESASSRFLLRWRKLDTSRNVWLKR